MKAPKLTALDRAIVSFRAVFDPQEAARTAGRRLMARQALAIMGGYTGARRDRASLAAWNTSPGSPEADVIVDLPMLRARSRDAERNQPVATGVVNTTASHAVGTGLTCNPKVDAKYLGLSEDQANAWQQDTRRRFLAWFWSKDCDLGRRQNGYELEDLALRTVLSSGDALIVTPMVQRPGASYPTLALQIIEADRISNPIGRQNSDTLTDGVECTADTGEAIAYHVSNRYPSDPRGARTWQRIEARGAESGRLNAIHLFKMLRPGLRRGVPILAPVMEPLKQLSRFTQAELDAAVASALFPLFAKMDPKAFDETFTEESQQQIVDKAAKWSGEIESMKVMNLLPGEEIQSPTPGRPNPEFDPFVTACVRQIGMAIGLPYEVLIMHYQSSYSAARGALLMAWRFFMGWRDWLATNLCQPVYELWLSEEVAAGRISARGFFSDPVIRSAWCGAQWVGDGPGSIDPSVDVKAARERVALGISTLQAESQLHDGVDWETKHQQSMREAAARKEAGLSTPGTAPPPPEPPPKPNPTDEQMTLAERKASLQLAQAHTQALLHPLRASVAPEMLAAQALQMKEREASIEWMKAQALALSREPQQPQQVHFHAGDTNVAAGPVPSLQIDNHIASAPSAPVTVEHHTHIDNKVEQPPAPNVEVKVEAQAPAEPPTVIVNNTVEPAPVVMNHPESSTAVHERNQNTGEIERTVTTYKAQE
jgi:lambda family phage portal protein